VFSGLRPGEKLYEDLFYADEVQMPTSHKKVRCAHAHRMSWTQLAQHLAELQLLYHDGSASSIRAKVKDIIPEYSYPIPMLPTYPSPLHDGDASIRLSRRMLAADVTGSA